MKEVSLPKNSDVYEHAFVTSECAGLIVKIGYPCTNRTIGCNANSTFRLKSYSETRLKNSIENNLECLQRILQFNFEHKLLFFRISSDLIPFASHPVNTFCWQDFFSQKFEQIGEFICKNRIRISMHPDQFTLINSTKDEVFERSTKELEYHTQLLDLMKLDTSAKIQIHIGGVYGDKKKSINRFVNRFKRLDEEIRSRLVIENDDRLYDLNDCLVLNDLVKIPILFDVFHHKLNNSAICTLKHAIGLAKRTWNRRTDGLPMVDYSSQAVSGLTAKHAETIDLKDFKNFLRSTRPLDFDIMLEIKDKEKSAIMAMTLAIEDPRITHPIR